MYFTAAAASFNGKMIRGLFLIRELLFLGLEMLFLIRKLLLLGQKVLFLGQEMLFLIRKLLFLGQKRDKFWLRR